MMLYLWIKAFHVIAVVTWFAGIFYLPRLFIYHAGADDSVSRERFKVMERKLYRIIMNPSMIVAVGLGLWLLILRWQAYASQGWLWLKVALVVVLIGYHHYCLRIMKAFERDEIVHDERFLRIFNEIPALVLIGSVILVIVKPF